MDEDEKLALERRLENWGRWLRQGAKKKGQSPLFSIMVGMGFTYEEPEKKDKEDEGKPKIALPPIDEADAIRVQDAWQAMPEGREKRYLEERYAFQRSGGKALRGLKYENKRWRIIWAYRMLWSRLTKTQYVLS